jgi:hypothetical protein
VGPLQAAGKQQSLEEKGVDVNWEPDDHRPGLGSRQDLVSCIKKRQKATIDSYAGHPLPRSEVVIQFTTSTTLHSCLPEASVILPTGDQRAIIVAAGQI